MAKPLGIAMMLAMLMPGPLVAEPNGARQAELMHRLKHDCGSCHGMTMKGGLGPALLPTDLAEREDAELIHVIMEGREGTPMPPWAFELAKDEAAWLVRRLKEGLEK